MFSCLVVEEIKRRKSAQTCFFKSLALILTSKFEIPCSIFDISYILLFPQSLVLRPTSIFTYFPHIIYFMQILCTQDICLKFAWSSRCAVVLSLFLQLDFWGRLGSHFSCHSLGRGNPFHRMKMDSRVRGNDKTKHFLNLDPKLLLGNGSRF